MIFIKVSKTMHLFICGTICIRVQLLIQLFIFSRILSTRYSVQPYFGCQQKTHGLYPTALQQSTIRQTSVKQCEHTGDIERYRDIQTDRQNVTIDIRQFGRTENTVECSSH